MGRNRRAGDVEVRLGLPGIEWNNDVPQFVIVRL